MSPLYVSFQVRIGMKFSTSRPFILYKPSSTNPCSWYVSGSSGDRRRSSPFTWKIHDDSYGILIRYKLTCLTVSNNKKLYMSMNVYFNIFHTNLQVQEGINNILRSPCDPADNNIAFLIVAIEVHRVDGLQHTFYYWTLLEGLRMGSSVLCR